MRHDVNGKEIRHGTWYHWIDSRTTRPEDATDEGDMYPMSADLTLEKGRMVNPATGRLTDYEEVWLDNEPISVPSNGFRCTVLQMTTEAGERGMMVCLGHQCQALSRTADGITAERWTWSNHGQGGWTCDIRLGSLELPCARILQNAVQIKEGAVFEIAGKHWKVIELH
jgi:hypothetical protein